jgi:hypothetical protein
VNDLPIPEFQRAIQEIYHARSQLRERVRVVETFEGETVWEGEVLVFELLDDPTAPKCYAWEVDGEVTAVLHEAPVDGPQTAVRAAIAAGENNGE